MKLFRELLYNSKNKPITMENIGIIGQGFVGSAINEVFKSKFNVLTYDKFVDERSNSSVEEIVAMCQNIFVCLPTPMDMSDGSASIAIVEDVVSNINQIAISLGKKPTIIIKSTVPVGTASQLATSIAPYCNIVFSPEFLTEANAVEDFRNQNRVVIGINENAYDIGYPEYVDSLIKMFTRGLGDHVEVVVTGSRIAELVKYTTNTFLSTKVSYANELYNIAESCDVDYKELIQIATLDKRLGDSHWMVPGPDGDFGFGGHCFPKDLAALRYLAKKNGVKTKVLDATQELNDDVRNVRDWEDQVGRAVINKIDKRGKINFTKIINITIVIYLSLLATLLAGTLIFKLFNL